MLRQKSKTLLQTITRKLIVEQPMKLDAFLHIQMSMPKETVFDKVRRGEITLGLSANALGIQHAPKGLSSRSVVLPGDLVNVVIQKRKTDKELTKTELQSVQRDMEEFAKELKQHVVYKDSKIMILNKPHGLATQGGSKIHVHIDKCLPYMKEHEKDDLKLVHRLDQNTSGLIIIARNAFTARKLAEMIQKGQIIKTYYAVVVNPLPVTAPQTIDTGIMQTGHCPNERMAITDYQEIAPLQGEPKIQRAITQYQIKSVSKYASLVELIPSTGRKHQLRVHCSQALKGIQHARERVNFIAHILGDYKYGSGIPTGIKNPFRPNEKIKMHLHLKQLVLPNWFVKSLNLKVECKFPKHFLHTMDCYKLKLEKKDEKETFPK